MIFWDLTPFSIYVQAENKEIHVTLTDYFLQTQFMKQRVYNRINGLRYFQAPEVGESYFDEECALWNVGAIFYILMTGNVPY